MALDTPEEMKREREAQRVAEALVNQ